MPWDLTPLKAQLRSRSATALLRGTELTVLVIQAAAPKVSGELANSVKSTRPNDSGNRFRSVITAESQHADWVYNGTGFFGPSHSAIVPTSSPYLVFQYAGVEVHATSVSGQRPNKKWWDEPIAEWTANVAKSLATMRGR